MKIDYELINCHSKLMMVHDVETRSLFGMQKTKQLKVELLYVVITTNGYLNILAKWTTKP